MTKEIENFSKYGAYHGGRDWQSLIDNPDSYVNLVPADVNDAFYPPAPRVVETIINWAHRANFGIDACCHHLSETIASRYCLPVEYIHLGCGSSDLLQALIISLVEPGEDVVMLDPTYSEYEHCVKFRKGNVRKLNLEEDRKFAFNAEEMVSFAKGARAVILCNPNNPTGQVLPRSELIKLLETLDSRVFVLVDEAYIDYCIKETIISDVTHFPNLVVVRTFSKAYALSALRIGYAALGKNVNRIFKSYLRPPWTVGLLAARAAEAALEEYQYVKEMVEETSRLKSIMVKRLGDIEQLKTFTSLTNYFLIKLQSPEYSSLEICNTLSKQQIFLRNCQPFGANLGSSFLRITTQREVHNELIINAIRTMFHIK